MDILSIGQNWIDRGFSVIPIRFKSKRPSFRALRWTGSTASWEPYKDRQATRDELRLWFGPSSPVCNLGLVTGFNGLVVIDFDTLDAYGMWLHMAVMQGGIMAAVAQHTYRVMTARGMHIYLRTVEHVESYQVGMIDVKACWGYVLVPPSVHPSGYLYEAIVPASRVMQVERLADVFPLERPVPTMRATRIEYTDPYEAASHAIDMSAGAIEDIKANMHTEDLLGLPRTGRRQAIKCPFHQDTNPSFYVYPDGGWTCFGCGMGGGDVIDLYAAIYKVTNREAIAALAERVEVTTY